MTEVWGQLDKSQTDNQKIDAAITAAITDHEADADAHVEAGESLQSHKAAEVIDHVVGSIVKDKLTMKELDYETYFDSLDRWTVVGAVDIDCMPGMKMYTDLGGTELTKLATPDEFYYLSNDWTKYILVEYAAKLDLDWEGIAYFGMGNFVTDAGGEGLGFKLVDTTLYGYLRDNGTPKTVEITGVSLGSNHVYRAEYDPATEKATFYVDGVVKGQLDAEEVQSSAFADLKFYQHITGGTEAILVFYRFRAARAI